MEPNQAIIYDRRKVACCYITALCCAAGTVGFVGNLFLLTVYKLSSVAPFLIVTVPCVACTTFFIGIRIFAPSRLSKTFSKLLAPKQQPEPMALSLTSLDLKVNLSCPVCFSTLADEVCVPCGHVFCEGCMKALREQCAICRKEILMTQKMYL